MAAAPVDPAAHMVAAAARVSADESAHANTGKGDYSHAIAGAFIGSGAVAVVGIIALAGVATRAGTNNRVKEDTEPSGASEATSKKKTGKLISVCLGCSLSEIGSDTRFSCGFTVCTG